MPSFPTQIPDCDSENSALLNIFLSSDPSICSTVAFRPLWNSAHVVVSVFIEFLPNPKDDYYYPDWAVFVISLEMFHGRISLNFVHLFLLNFVNRTRLKLNHISIFANIGWGLIHLHGLQQITSWVCISRINLLHLDWSSDRLLTVTKGFLKLSDFWSYSQGSE